VRVPAKINLFLHVGPVRSDGYHELVTVFQAVDLFDEITVAPCAMFRLSVSGRGATEVPTDETNLAWRAAALLAQEFGGRATNPPLTAHIHIDKHIPVAGGMAGGSADAAGALVGCAQLWGIELSDDELHGLAAQLGSDVNFCLTGGTALGRGRGEQLTPLPTSGAFHWAVALAEGGISAGAAYRELDRLREPAQAIANPQGGAGVLEVMTQALANGEVTVALAAMENDLEAAAVSLMPELRRTLDSGPTGHVSGSGPTCIFGSADGARAHAVAQHLRDSGTCVDAFVAVGPVPGPAPRSIRGT